MSTPEEAARKKLSHWATQTILFAMMLQQEDDTPEGMAEMGRNADRIAREILEQAKAESENPGEFLVEVVERVFGWVSEHRFHG